MVQEIQNRNNINFKIEEEARKQKILQNTILLNDEKEQKKTENKIKNKTQPIKTIAPFYKDDQLVGKSNEEYKIIENIFCLDRMQVYLIDEQQDKIVVNTDLQLRLIFNKEQQNFERGIYHLIQYQNGMQGYKGASGELTENDIQADLQSFLHIFEFWSVYDPLTEQYILLVVEEHLLTLEDEFEKMSLETVERQDQVLSRVLYNFSLRIYHLHDSRDGFGDLKTHVEITLNNLFFREKSQYQSTLTHTEQIPVISYRKFRLFDQQELKIESNQEFIYSQNSFLSIFNEILASMKEKKMLLITTIQELIEKEKDNLISQSQQNQNITPQLQKGEVIQWNEEEEYEIKSDGEVYSNYVLYELVQDERKQIMEYHCKDENDLDFIEEQINEYSYHYDYLNVFKHNFQEIGECQMLDDLTILIMITGKLEQTRLTTRLTDENIPLKTILKNINHLVYLMSYINEIQEQKYCSYRPENIHFTKDLETLSEFIPYFSFNQQKPFDHNDAQLNQLSQSTVTKLIQMTEFIQKLGRNFLPQINNIEVLELDYTTLFKRGKQLGEGGFGQVISVTFKDDPIKIKYALKILIKSNFQEIIREYQESQIALLFERQAPLLNVHQIFLQELEGQKFSLNILMPKAKSDLKLIIDDINMEIRKKLSFEEFYPMLRDIVLGIVYMHSQGICHRDIKPQNIMEMNSNLYVHADFGCGQNIKDRETHIEGDYQKVDMHVAGTPTYMDPRMYQAFKKYMIWKKSDTSSEAPSMMIEKLDMLKADIYSAGITLIQLAAGKKTIKYNSSRKYEKDIYLMLHQLNYPIEVIQLLIAMTKYEDQERMPTYSLFKSMRSIMTKLSTNLRMYKKQKLIKQKEFKKYQSIIKRNILYIQKTITNQRDQKDFFEFSEKLIKISQSEPTFYDGKLRISYQNSQIQKDDLVLVKPNFIPGIIIEANLQNNKESFVNIMGQKHLINNNQLITVQIPIFKKGQQVKYFLKSKNTWEIYKVVDVNMLKRFYVIKKLYTLNIPFGSLKLQQVLFFDSLNQYLNQSYQQFDTIISQNELKLINSYSSPINNQEQLYEKSYDLTYNGFDTLDMDYHKYSEKSIFERLYKIEYANSRGDFEDNQISLLIHSKCYPKMRLKEIIYFNFNKIQTGYDAFGQVQGNYDALQTLLTDYLFFSKKEYISNFFQYLSSAKALRKLELNGLGFYSQQNQGEKLVLKGLDTLLKNLPLIDDLKIVMDPVEDSNVLVPLSQLAGIFQAISNKKLKRVFLTFYTYEVEGEKVLSSVQKLEKAFARFMKNQNEFWFLYLQISLQKTPQVTANNLKCLTSFVKEKYNIITRLECKNDFRVLIYSNHFHFLFQLFPKSKKRMGYRNYGIHLAKRLKSKKFYTTRKMIQKQRRGGFMLMQVFVMEYY